jgi:uncharacterized protein DUF222
VATPETEERLLAVGRAGPTEHVERIVRGWRRMDRKAETREAARQDAGRSLHVYPDEDGTVRIRGRLAPEVGALLLKALGAARETLCQRQHDQALDGDPPTMEQLQADALALLAETALHHRVLPVPLASATRSLSMSMQACWPTLNSRGSQCSRTGYAFRPERRSAWRATPAGS